MTILDRHVWFRGRGDEKRISRILCALVATLSFAACFGERQELTEADVSEIEAAVLDATNAEWDAWLGKTDIDRYMSFFSDWSVAPFPSATSMEDFRSGIVDMWTELSSIELVEMGDLRVRVLGSRAAAVEGAFVQTVTDTAGSVEEWRGVFTWIWVLEDGRWKILAGKNNPLPENQ